jgi:hypothetical protein
MFSVYRDQKAMTTVLHAWERADEAQRQAILRAVHSLDRQLQHAPHEQGESRGGAARIIFCGPLAMIFEVDEAKKLVNVLRAWTVRAAA